MKVKPLKILLVSTPVGSLGSGKGGGVEITLTSLVKGLVDLGHQIILVAPEGSNLPEECKGIDLRMVPGLDQPSWQHQKYSSPVVMPPDSILPAMWNMALEIGNEVDAILNFGYDWLPLWVTPHVEPKIFHLISMGAVSKVMKDQVMKLSVCYNNRLAFHTYSQASDYQLNAEPTVVGNGFDLNKYDFNSNLNGPLGWAGRIAPEKGLEDAVSVAASLGDQLLVWGIIEDQEYAQRIEDSYPSGTIDWRGFLDTNNFQKQLGECRALINTPKWNEAYGNVVVEAMACGVPVVAYKRGGPGELIKSGSTGWLVEPDDVKSLIKATLQVKEIDRKQCREWALNYASCENFAQRITIWIQEGILDQSINLA